MKSQYRAVNRYISKILSSSSIDWSSNSGTFQVEDTTVGWFSLPTWATTFFVTADFAQTWKEEILRIVNVSWNTLTYDKRISVGSYVKPAHTAWASIRINDVADIINEMSENIDNFGEINAIDWTATIRVWWGVFNNGWTVYNVASQIFSISGGQLVDNSTNYVHFDLTTRLFLITASSTLAWAVCMGSVVVTAWAIWAIWDIRPGLNTTYWEITTKLDKAGGLRDTFGVNKTVIVDRTSGAEVVKNVVDITQFASTDVVRLRQTSGDYADITMGNLSSVLDSTSHYLYSLTALTAPVAVDTFNTKTVGSYTAVNSPNLLNANSSAGSNSQGAGTFVFIPKHNMYLNSTTINGGSGRYQNYTYSIKETVSGTVLYTFNVTSGYSATETFPQVFLRAWVSYTYDTATNTTPYSGYTVNDTPDLDMVSYSGWYCNAMVFNYTLADAYTFGFSNNSVTSWAIANGTTISTIQLNLKKNGTPAADVSIQLFDSSNNAISGGTATILQSAVTTSFATYTATLATPYSPIAGTIFKIKVSTSSVNTSHYYFIQWQQGAEYAAANSTTDTIANTVFYPYFSSAGIQPTVFIQSQPAWGKYAGLVLNNVSAGARAFARTSWFAQISGLTENTTYYVNTDWTGSLTTSTASWVSVGKTYGPNLILKMP